MATVLGKFLQTTLFLGAIFISIDSLLGEERTIPSFTAYSLPKSNGIAISERRGASKWQPENRLVWYGSSKGPSKLNVSIELQMQKGTTQNFRMSIGSQSRESTVSAEDDSTRRVTFGEFTIEKPGYHAFSLEALKPESMPGLVVKSMILEGEKVGELHFNLLERRNAASVHLKYPTPKEWKIDRFYLEVTAVDDPEATFYMACGFRRGYFGMQVNSSTERRIIFSVWDAGKGTNADRRDQVAKEDYVQLVEKGADVHANEFGGEGTGGHSHLKTMWKTGEKQHFLLLAKPIDGKTEYAGYYFHPDQRKWILISRMLAPSDGNFLGGLHSFSENFGGQNGNVRRKALYGNQWVRTSDGDWHELTAATFSHDPTGKADRLDRFMGVEKGEFFLSHGGFVDGFTEYGVRFERPATEKVPAILLEELP